MSKVDELKTKLAEIDAKLDANRKTKTNTSNTPSKEEVFGTPIRSQG
jgi:hypothetical protein